MQVSGKYTSNVIARNIDIDIKEFDHYNPEFDKRLAIGERYNLQLHNEKMVLFTKNKYEILNECVDQMLTNVRMDSRTVNGNQQVNKKE